jgi:hypothetical protein
VLAAALSNRQEGRFGARRCGDFSGTVLLGHSQEWCHKVYINNLNMLLTSGEFLAR